MKDSLFHFFVSDCNILFCLLFYAKASASYYSCMRRWGDISGDFPRTSGVEKIFGTLPIPAESLWNCMPAVRKAGRQAAAFPCPPPFPCQKNNKPLTATKTLKPTIQRPAEKGKRTTKHLRSRLSPSSAQNIRNVVLSCGRAVLINIANIPKLRLFI